MNAGLPRPDDRLGEPTRIAILGTQGSDIYSEAYSRYLREYERVKNTTKDAFTYRYWRTLKYPNASGTELWPARYCDGRINASDDTDSEA